MQQHVIPSAGRWLWIALLATLPWGCARVNDAGMRLVSSKLSGMLIVNGQLLTGNVTLIPDRTGRVSFSAEKGKIRNCSGAMRYTASFGGEIDLRCNDGTQVALQTTLLSETRGYGYGGTAEVPASIAYGLSDEDALAFLTVPPGMVLATDKKSGDLELQMADATPKLGPAAAAAPAVAKPSGAAPESPGQTPAPAPGPGK